MNTVSTPFSHSCTILPADAEDLFEAALGIAHAVKKKHGTTYTVSYETNLIFKLH